MNTKTLYKTNFCFKFSFGSFFFVIQKLSASPAVAAGIRPMNKYMYYVIVVLLRFCAAAAAAAIDACIEKHLLMCQYVTFFLLFMFSIFVLQPLPETVLRTDSEIAARDENCIH